MKFTLPAAITFALLSTLASASPHAGNHGNFKAIARGGIPVARNGHNINMYERQTTSSEGEGGSTSDGDTTSGEDAGTSSGDDAGQASEADTAASTPTYTYDGSGGEVGDSGPALTATESGVTPTMYTLTSDTAANVEATSADPNAQPSMAPSQSASASSSSHSGLTNYNTTTRSQSQSLVGTSAAQTTGSARASASSSQANSAALPNIMPNISPLSLITVVLAGGLGVVRVLA